MQGVEILVNKRMSNKTSAIRRLVQHLVPLEISKGCKNEVPIELNE